MIYIIILSAIIGNLNNNLGINIFSGIKLNLTDLLLIITFFYLFILKKNKLYVFKPIKLVLILLLIMGIQIFLGVINGGELADIIRILRNYVYILLMFWITVGHSKNRKNFYTPLIVLSWVAILNCIITVAIDLNKYNWFKYYRENSSFQVYMFIFLLLYKNENKQTLINNLLQKITMIFLGICIFLSQERLQIVAVVLSIIFYYTNKIIHILKDKKISYDFSFKRILVVSTTSLCTIVIILLVINNEYIKSYFEYFSEYRMGSILKNGSLVMDSSLEGRLTQLKVILNTNFMNFIIGRGLASKYLSAGGYTYIVDGMWLWIFKDLGLIGLLIIFYMYYCINKEIKKIPKNRDAILFGCISIAILQIFTPNIMLGISDSVFIGYIMGQIYISRIMKF